MQKACVAKGVRWKRRAMQKACDAKGVQCKRRAMQKGVQCKSHTMQNLFENPVVNSKSLSKNLPWASSPFEILTVRSSAVSFGQKKPFSEILNFYDTTHLVHKLEEGQFFFSSTLQLLEVGDATSWIFFSSMGLDFIGLKVVKRWFSRGGGLHRPV